MNFFNPKAYTRKPKILGVGAGSDEFHAGAGAASIKRGRRLYDPRSCFGGLLVLKGSRGTILEYI